jgi:hypothetical protein
MFRFYGLLALVPLLVGFAGVWSRTLQLTLLAIPIALIVILIGTLFQIDRGMKLPLQPGQWRQRAIATGLAPVLLVVSVAAIIPLFVAGNFGGSLMRLVINRDHYEAIVAKARAAPAQRFGEDHGVLYTVAAGPPVRVAFDYAEMRMFWGTTVYDPSGDVMRAKGIDPSGRVNAPGSVQDLGFIVACHPLWGDYYTCWEDD